VRPFFLRQEKEILATVTLWRNVVGDTTGQCHRRMPLARIPKIYRVIETDFGYRDTFETRFCDLTY
jgi:hypothetical protein